MTELDVNVEAYETVGRRLQALHEHVREVAPDVERIACALYDATDGVLKTFINSTLNGTAIRGYQYRLEDSESLSYLARTGELRLLEDIPSALQPTTLHSTYVLDEGFQSSFTVPMYHQGEFLGFLFYDSRQHGTFSPLVQRELTLYSSLITMAVAAELIAVRSVVGSMSIARDFAQLRDLETGAHLERMARYSRLLAKRLIEPLDLADEYVEHVFLYAPLHDIGKVGIPDAVLLKPGPLDPDEWEVMKTHTTLGRRMVEHITADLRLESLPADAVLKNIVELHHEKLDGSGYPYGLRGDDVPLEARIVAVADMYDALTSSRPYKRAWTTDDAFDLLDRDAREGRLDRMVVDALIDSRVELEDVQARNPEVLPDAAVEA